MKFQSPILNFEQTDGRTAQSNMSLQPFLSCGHTKAGSKFHQLILLRLLHSTLNVPYFVYVSLL